MANELKTLITRRLTLLELGAKADEEYRLKREDIDSDLLEVLEQIADHAQASEASPKPAPKRRTKPKVKEPDHDAVAKKYDDFEPSASGCRCGCGEDVVPGSDFVRGHQNRLKSIALAVKAGALDSDKLSHAGNQYALAQGWVGPKVID